MTPPPATMRRNAAAISSRRAMTAWSGAGISIALPLRPRHSGTALRAGPGIHEHGLRVVRRIVGASWPGVVVMDSGLATAQRSGMTVLGECLALACLEARIGLVDDVDPPLAPHDAAVLVALLQRLQRIGNLHDTDPRKARNIGSGMPPVNPCQSPGLVLVDVPEHDRVGFEDPVHIAARGVGGDVGADRDRRQGLPQPPAQGDERGAPRGLVGGAQIVAAQRLARLVARPAEPVSAAAAG